MSRSRLRGVLELEASPEAAQASCVQVFREMGWHVTVEQGDMVEAREDPAQLPCHHSPAQTKLLIEDSGDGCSVTIETRVPGFGPIAASHTRGHQATIVRRVHAMTTA